jgi:hypothetical protein
MTYTNPFADFMRNASEEEKRKLFLQAAKEAIVEFIDTEIQRLKERHIEQSFHEPIKDYSGVNMAYKITDAERHRLVSNKFIRDQITHLEATKQQYL